MISRGSPVYVAVLLSLSWACDGENGGVDATRDADSSVDGSLETGHDAGSDAALNGPAKPGLPGADAGADAGDAATEPDGPPPEPNYWFGEVVPQDQVLEVCKLDPVALAAADTALDTPWAVIRYGKLCHQYMAEGMKRRPAWSVTKTLGAVVTGMASYQTRELAHPLRDSDLVSSWLTDFPYNQNATIAHVLAMVAHNQSLAYGEKTMEYDTVGSVQINSLSEVISRAIAQDSARLGVGIDAFVQSFLFDKLQMKASVWSDRNPTQKNLGFSWNTDVYDMAKLGLLMLRGGVWNGERLLESEWVYRMTHPAFEDANTGYGYLTWLNSTMGWRIGLSTFLNTTPLPELPGVGAINPGPCAPVALWPSYPHGPFEEAPSCGYDALVRSCEQAEDVGVWQAIGLLGQVIQGHRGLDMVLVGMDLTVEEGITPEFRNEANPSAKLWDAVRPAVVNADPIYQGDEAEFCAAYGSNAYAPDLQDW